MKTIQIRQMVHANICVRDMDRSVPFYEMPGFEKFADQIFAEGAGVWRGLGLEANRRFRAVFMKIPGDNPVPFLDIIQTARSSSTRSSLATHGMSLNPSNRPATGS